MGPIVVCGIQMCTSLCWWWCGLVHMCVVLKKTFFFVISISILQYCVFFLLSVSRSIGRLVVSFLSVSTFDNVFFSTISLHFWWDDSSARPHLYAPCVRVCEYMWNLHDNILLLVEGANCKHISVLRCCRRTCRSFSVYYISYMGSTKAHTDMPIVMRTSCIGWLVYINKYCIKRREFLSIFIHKLKGKYLYVLILDTCPIIILTQICLFFHTHTRSHTCMHLSQFHIKWHLNAANSLCSSIRNRTDYLFVCAPVCVCVRLCMYVQSSMCVSLALCLDIYRCIRMFQCD